MAMYSYRCESCDKTPKKLVEPKDADLQLCTCGALLIRVMGAPSVRVVEKIDNGIMPKAVERLADVEQLAHDYAKSKENR